MVSWSTRGLSSKKDDIVSFLYELHGGEEISDTLVRLMELSGKVDSDWLWHTDSVVIHQGYMERGGHMSTGLVVNREVLDPTTAHRVSTWNSAWREFGGACLLCTSSRCWTVTPS